MGAVVVAGVAGAGIAGWHIAGAADRAAGVRGRSGHESVHESCDVMELITNGPCH